MMFENDSRSTKRGERNRNYLPNTYTGVGKLPPQATDLEEAVLGAIMLERDALPRVVDVLHTDVFYSNQHQRIYDAIIGLFRNGDPIDILTVTSELRKRGELELIGGAYYITELTNRVASAANIEYHCQIIIQKFTQREVIRISTEAIQIAYEDSCDGFDLIDNLSDDLNKVKSGVMVENTEKDAVMLANELREEQKKIRVDGLLGPSIGSHALDYILKGDQPGDVRIVAAATSMGKSIEVCSEVLNCCFDEEKNLLDVQIPVAIFNLEMISVKISTRLLSNLSSIPKDKIALNIMNTTEQERYEHYLKEFEKSKIFIEDCDELNINQLERKIRHLHKKHGVLKFYIDYVQLLKPDPNKKFATRELELADIGRRLKQLAKKLKVTIIEVLQLNEEVLKSHLCLPNKNHIRECKALGHDADVIMFIWRPEYYEQVLNSISDLPCSLFPGVTITDFTNMGFYIVDKNREGKLGKVPFRFNGDLMRISDHPLILDWLRQKENKVPYAQGEFELRQDNCISPF